VRVARRVRRAGRGNPPGAILAGRPGPTQLAAAARPAVAPAPRTRPCHTGTRARPRCQRRPFFTRWRQRPARKPAAAGYPLACRPSRYPRGQAGN